MSRQREEDAFGLRVLGVGSNVHLQPKSIGLQMHSRLHGIALNIKYLLKSSTSGSDKKWLIAPIAEDACYNLLAISQSSLREYEQ